MFTVIGAKRDKCRFCRDRTPKDKEGFLIKDGPVKGFFCKDHFYSLAMQDAEDVNAAKVGVAELRSTASS